MKKIRKLNFSRKVFLACLCIAIIPFLFSGIMMFQLFQLLVTGQWRTQGVGQLDAAASELTKILEAGEKACISLSGEEKIARALIDNSTTGMQENLYLSLYETTQKISSNASFEVYDIGGKLRFSMVKGEKNKELPVYWGLIKKVSEAGKMVYYRTDPELGFADSNIVLQGAYPIFSKKGIKTGYLVLDFSKEYFDSVFHSLSMEEDILAILDNFGEPVYCSKTTYDSEEIKAMIMDEDCLISKELPYGYFLILKKNPPVNEGALNFLKMACLIVSCLGLLFSLVVTAAISKSISKPIHELSRAMDCVKKGDLSVQ